MDIANLNPDMLRKLLNLIESRAELVSEIDSLDSQIKALTTGTTSAPAPARRLGRPPKAAAKAPKATRAPKAPKAPKAAKAPKAPKASKAPKAARAPKATAAKASAPAKTRKPGKPGKRGALKQQIVNLLSSAGAEGLAVKAISEKLGVKNQNVHVWFSTTGKKMPEISKVGEARYAFKAS